MQNQPNPPNSPAPRDQAPVLELRQVVKTYRARGSRMKRGGYTVVALNRVSFSVQPGEIFGLVGESGSGKTTCGRLVVGLEKPDQGSLLLEGRDIAGLKGDELKDYRRKVQMVFQDPYQSLNPQLSVLESVAEPLITHRLGDADQRREKVIQALSEAGLRPPEDFIARFPHQLSGGQRQRVSIARGIVLGPRCLVADEPTSMLDASYSAQIFDILLRVREHFSAAIVFITHSLAAARYLCDRVAVLYRGNLMEMGPAREVITRPRHPYTQALMDATPKFARGQEASPRFDTLLPVARPSEGISGCAFFPRCRLAHRTRCSLETPAWHHLGDGHEAACHYVVSPG